MRFRSVLLSLGLLATRVLVRAAPHAPRQSTTKYVVAHVIVGNLDGYTTAQWTSDITLAQANGIDGFALNIGPDVYTPDQLAAAYDAADALNTGFKLFLSLDMSVFPCTAATDAEPLVNYTSTYMGRPSQLLYDGAALVSTFSGSDCTFGQGDSATGWRTQFTQSAALAGKVHFVPSFFIAPESFSAYNGVMDGAFNFNSGWPVDLTVATAPQLLPGVDFNNLTPAEEAELQQYLGNFASDSDYITNGLSTLAGGANPPTYMAAIAPWFFTHFSPQTYNKNWVYDCDEHLWARRWQTLIANRDQVDLVEILTWNDFGESHYIGPIEGNLPPGSNAWVDGFDHQAWLRMTNYFATQFKTGQAPAISQDKLVLWARPHPTNATATSDPVGPPTTFQLLQDKFWAVVFATADGELTLTSGANTQTFNVTAGVNLTSLALSPGSSMQGTLTRNGATVIDLPATGFTFNPTPSLYNYNAYVIDSTA